MKHGSLFSGIGGFDLAAEWMGWENEFHCEWNEFGRKILNYYWPEAKSYEDITRTDFNIYRGRIDILSGGFPCQPYSSAGKRLGKEDDRHLWPEMLRAIREIQPRYVVAENVLGLTNWNEGLVFNEVQVDLENEGYEVQPFILPACAIGAPHRRDRVWFVSRLISDTSSDGQHGNKKSKKGFNDQRGGLSFNEPNTLHGSGIITDTDSIRQQGSGRTERQEHTEKREDWKKYRAFDEGGWKTKSAVCSGDDGFSSQLDEITFSDWSKESIKAAGNAIVPGVALQIFKTINAVNFA